MKDLRLPCCSGGSYVSIAGCLNKNIKESITKLHVHFLCVYSIEYNDFLVLQHEINPD